MVRIRIAEKHDGHAWDEFVTGHGLSGPFHLFAWREAVGRAYGHTSRYLVAHNDAGAIEGVLPLILVKPPFLQGYLVSLPFCDYGGPLARSPEAAGLLVRRAAELARSSRSKLEIRCAGPDTSMQAAPSLGPVSHKSRMLLDLPGSATVLWDSFKSKLRSQIRRPQKDGMEFRMGSADYLDHFYHVFSTNMKELGSPVHARAWIASVLDAYGGRAHVGMVYRGAEPVAGGVVIEHRDTVTIPWASALSAYSRSSPNMLLYWGFLRYAADNGFKRFDFGRSTPGEGTYLFKAQWGARPEPLSWYVEGNADAQDAAAKPGRIRQAVASVWSRLPGDVANALGPRIRGYITL